MDCSTIAAIATPAGAGGIGIIRMSGRDAVRMAEAIFRPGGPGKGRPPGRAVDLQPWRLHYGRIIDPATGRTVDEVLLAVMRGPHSYTREDVVEIQAHAGPAVLKRIMTLLTDRGVRPAEPGEFTRRAFLNGRIDLTQAEAVIDLITARSEAALEMAAVQMAGGLKAEIDRIGSGLNDLLAELEALIDFPDAVDDEIDYGKLSAVLARGVAPPIDALIARHDAEEYLRTGCRVTIIGGPNVGKSSLLNRLTGSERAIVSDLPGTTRDFIEVPLYAAGIPILLSDTAGIRTGADPIERLGINKTFENIESSDIVLFVVDAGLPAGAEDFDLFDKLARKRFLLIINKIDLSAERRRFCLPPGWEAVRRVETSALHNSGIDTLRQMIAELAGASSSGRTDRPVPNLRHRGLLVQARQSVDAAINGLAQGVSAELVAIDLRSARDALSEITGERIPPDLLDRIFDRYCIGK